MRETSGGVAAARSQVLHYGETRAHANGSTAIVVGAGPAGLTTALALHAFGIATRIAAPAHDLRRVAADQRTTALLPGSVELLKNLGIWASCANAAAPLEGVRIVDDRGGLLRAPEVLFRAAELGLPYLGINVPNAVLASALEAAVTARLERITTSAVVAVAPAAESIDLMLAEGTSLRARLAVAADGRNSSTRAAAGIAVRTWAYDQAAIAAVFRHAAAHANITTEFHRRAGPLTVVPLPDHASSLVWVETPQEVHRLAALDDRAFLGELESHLKGLVGALEGIGPRAVFPLGGLAAERMGQHRVALVGEAAHAIPPIGAQGLNLGLRDAAVLAECAGAAQARGEDIGAASTLAAYHAARAADVTTRTVSVDLLNRSLISDVFPAQAARGLGLHLIANLGALRRLLMQGGLAAPGPTPKLMQPQTGS